MAGNVSKKPEQSSELNKNLNDKKWYHQRYFSFPFYVSQINNPSSICYGIGGAKLAMKFLSWLLSALVLWESIFYVSCFTYYPQKLPDVLTNVKSRSYMRRIPPRLEFSSVKYNHFKRNAQLHASASTLIGSDHLLSIVTKTFHASGVQKMLELGVIMSIGFFLRNKLDAKALNAVLLNALIPAGILSSLSSLQLSLGLGLIVLSGALLAVVQIISGDMASRFIISKDEKNNKIPSSWRRTAAMQLGTMAPAASVFSFTREFVGAKYVGFAALADVPNKIYSLLLIPRAMRYRASIIGEKKKQKLSKKQTMKSIISDPFNLAIGCGLGLAAMRCPLSNLGFFGRAITNLAQTQTAILFLLIGLKLKVGKGENDENNSFRLCLRLLLARHGFVGLFVSLFMAVFLRQPLEASAASKLALVLSSNAACSIICFGQMTKVVSSAMSSKEIQSSDSNTFYDLDLAFDIIAISYPLTILLNTITCLAGASYVKNLPIISLTFIILSRLTK